jgi:thiomorpholine-carboxylate dehydrogenase
MRTSATSAIATDLLAITDTRTLAILGSGVQAHAHLEALRHVRKFDEVRVWSRNPAHAEAFADQTGARAMSAEQAVRGADVIVTATNSPEPILQGDWLKPGCHINAVGAVGSTRRELDTAAVRGAYIAVESRVSAAAEAGDLLMAGAHVDAELGELLAGKVTGPRPWSVYKSVGIAVEDLAAARLVV